MKRRLSLLVQALILLSLILSPGLAGAAGLPRVTDNARAAPFPPDASPEEARVLEDVEAAYQADYLHLATGDAQAAHATYAWPFNVSFTLGHAIQSYQNYSSGTSAAYFHHGIDIMAPNGTDVFNRSGGQVVNVENYQPGNDLYWEVAVKDPEGYIWQYHHIDKNTIPQAIKDKFAEYQANPTSGGYIAPNTYIGDIVYWTVTSFGKRFNHIHLNILAAGGAYVNGFEFHTPLNDTAAPLLQTIGLLKNNTVQTVTTITGVYGLYVRAKDLVLDDVYYLPPHQVDFTVDGGPVTTVWEFANLPGGASDTAYVNDYYVAPPTCGNYSCREFYVDLGFTTGGQRVFPVTNGAHTVNVTVYDYAGNSTSRSFTWTVTGGPTPTPTPPPSNTAPVANAQAVTTDEDVAAGMTLSGSDAENSPLTYSVQTGPSHGTLSGTAPNLTYAPAANYHGPDSFTFVVNDGTANSAPATVSITVAAVNDAPVANAQSVTTAEDTAKTIALIGSDVDGDALTYILLTQPSHGALGGVAPNIVYTPAANYHGSDSFTFAVNDGSVNSALSTVNIDVTAVNDVPVATPQSVVTQQETPVDITLLGADVDGGALTYRVVTWPVQGVLSGDAPDLTYTPGAGYTGGDSFTFVANDGIVDSALATVDITVTETNDQPTADAQSVTTDEDTALAILLTGSDPDADPIAFAVTAAPQHGTLSGTAPGLTYTPAADYNGIDSFAFVTNDGQVDSTPATVSISVTAVNDAPLADAQAVTTAEDAAVAIALSGSDVDGDALTYAVVNGPSHGTLGGTAPALTYTPAANYSGSDGFTFSVDDGQAAPAEAVVSITVTPVNDAPMADALAVTAAEDTAFVITLTGSDVDGNALSFAAQTQPSHGSLSGTAPVLTYTPAANYNGPDSFTFTASDGTVNSAPATVSIDVSAVNDAPVAIAQAVTTEQGAAVAVMLGASDVDGDIVTYNVVTGPANGTLTGVAPDLTYTPAAGYTGLDGFIFAVSDGMATSDPATVSITVNPAGPVTVFFDDFESDLGWSRNPNGTDAATLGVWERVDPEAVDYYGYKQLGTTVSGSYDLVTGPLAGAGAGSYDLDGGVTSIRSADIALPAGSELALSFSYYLANYTNSSTADYLRVKVVGATTQTVFEELGAADDDDAAWDTFSGSLNAFAGQTIYLLIEAADASTASLVEAAVDDVLIIATGGSPNQTPTADPQSVSTAEDTALPIVLTGVDGDGNPLIFSVTGGPSHGTLSGTAPSLTYTPASGYSGADSFTFKVNDGVVDSAPATVSITITPAVTGPKLYLGSSTSGTAGGVAFEDEDILIKDMSTGAWSLYIDGSDIGLTNTDVDAFELQADGSLLMSFDTAFSLSGFAAVDDSDILRFRPDSTGATTAGTWSWYFDGSDVGLSTSDEDIDAFAILPDGRLLISTLGNVSVTGASGADEDLLVFTPTALGATTTGTWAMYFDGSDVGLSSTSNENVNGVWVDAAGKIYLTTLGAFSVTGASGDGSDIFTCTPGSLGSTTTCSWAMYWDGSVQGFAGEDTDSLSIVQ